jgi:BlaI family transcriptional regulator, penicillinase repressor
LHFLGPLETTVMDVVWAHTAVTAEQVRRLLETQQPLKDSNVRTILRRLEQKGYVKHRVQGRVFVYQSKVRPQRVAAQAVRRIIDRFCAGSVETLLVGMVDDQIVSHDELADLVRKIAEAEQ